MTDAHDTEEWAQLVAVTARLGVVAAQWDRARIAYLARVADADPR